MLVMSKTRRQLALLISRVIGTNYEELLDKLQKQTYTHCHIGPRAYVGDTFTFVGKDWEIMLWEVLIGRVKIVDVSEVAEKVPGFDAGFYDRSYRILPETDKVAILVRRWKNFSAPSIFKIVLFDGKYWCHTYWDIKF